LYDIRILRFFLDFYKIDRQLHFTDVYWVACFANCMLQYGGTVVKKTDLVLGSRIKVHCYFIAVEKCCKRDSWKNK
jgi:hypothetical protein